MKKVLVTLILTTSLVSHADIYDIINFFNFSKFVSSTILVAQGIADNLEKVRTVQQEKLPIQEQWALVCETTQNLNKSVEALGAELVKYKVGQEYCAPISQILNMQADIIKNCQNYYNKPVPENVQHLINKFTMTVFQSRMLLVKCYPELGKIKLPLPGKN